MREIQIGRQVADLLATEFEGLYIAGTSHTTSIKAGQTAADTALATLEISRYAKLRSEVLPLHKRAASRLSPYIRHNLLTLQQVWDAVAEADYENRSKFRDELLWQEYSRHVYARIGTQLHDHLRYQPTGNKTTVELNSEMNCISFVKNELESSGWLVNQTRMWFASEWSVRNSGTWQSGADYFYQHLLDGSRAANSIGWQWTAGAITGKQYGFSQWQVQKRAPKLCTGCPLNSACPISDFPAETELAPVQENYLLSRDTDPELTAGPREVLQTSKPEVVMLTIDSLGDADPALSANPDLSVVFVFHEPALRKLQLSANRIAFYIETLQDLSNRRDLRVFVGDKYEFAREHSVAVTHAPVPSFKPLTESAAELHPWPWLVQPHSGSIKSFSAWRNKVKLKS